MFKFLNLIIGTVTLADLDISLADATLEAKRWNSVLTGKQHDSTMTWVVYDAS